MGRKPTNVADVGFGQDFELEAAWHPGLLQVLHESFFVMKMVQKETRTKKKMGWTVRRLSVDLQVESVVEAICSSEQPYAGLSQRDHSFTHTYMQKAPTALSA